MPVVQVGQVRVKVGERRVHMRMRVRPAGAGFDIQRC